MPSGPLRLLLIADDPGAAARLFGHADPPLPVTTLAAGDAAAALADPAGWHAVVLEAPPDSAARPELVRQFADLAAGLPLIALTETEADADAARQAGASISLVKSQIPPHARVVLIQPAAELRRAQLALAAGEARFRNIIERNADGILVTDLEGRVRFANPAAEALLGRSALELRGAAFGFPIVTGETTEVDVLRRPGQAAVAEMRVVDTQWEGQPACLASLRDITDRKRVEAAEREQRGLAEALRDTAAALASTLDFEGVLDRILANVGRVTSHDTAGIMLLEAPGLVRVVRSRGYGPADTAAAPSPLRRIAEWAGLRQIAATHQPLAVPDTEAFPDWVSGSTTSWVRSYVGAPLRIKDEVIGFINLNSATPGYFARSHADRLQAFADQAAVAIENARLYDSRQQSADEIAALYRASGLLLGSPADLPNLANQIAHAIRQEFAISACNVYLIDEAAPVLHCLAHQGRGGEPEASVPVHTPGLLGTAARTGEPIYAPDVAHEPRYVAAAPLTRSQLVIPLRASGRVLGVLDLQSEALDAFDQRAQRIISAFAERAGLAFENARLFRQAVRSAERRSTLYWATQAISASLDREQVCTAVHKAAAQVMTVDAILIALRTEDGQEVEDVFHVDRGRRVAGRRRPARLGLSGHVLATGETIRSPHFEALEADDSAIPPMVPLRSILAVPLRAGDRLLGMLAVYSETPNAYSSDDQMLLEMLAAHAAIVLENARLFADAQRLANVDALTRLYNRRHFFELGQHEFERAARYRSPLTILIADVDHFKSVNDTYGHLAGDQVLRDVAARCRTCLRDVDILGRYGGEEFVVLMPETSAADARTAAERLRQSVAHTPILTDRGPVSVTLSAGAAEMEPGYDISLETILDRADQALYAAKQTGRNSLVFWSTHLPRRTQPL